eukprot:TRINITY_DN4410_c0_g1_i1.p1 TRINITY_DN4410_c0_g1~~TRINITY_DN4410_c0_g1_i1.p1  ORF type:complete len:512 (+),score=90.43 TRINITY_DN4410_c0_g1_i1:577-2112(+)
METNSGTKLSTSTQDTSSRSLLKEALQQNLGTDSLVIAATAILQRASSLREKNSVTPSTSESSNLSPPPAPISNSSSFDSEDNSRISPTDESPNPSDTFSEDSPSVGLKRTQVPKACANCRKLHAACDLQRPCKRCIQGGLIQMCSDVPRKKRVSKKRKDMGLPLGDEVAEDPNWASTYDSVVNQQTNQRPDVNSQRRIFSQPLNLIPPNVHHHPYAHPTRNYPPMPNQNQFQPYPVDMYVPPQMMQHGPMAGLSMPPPVSAAYMGQFGHFPSSHLPSPHLAQMYGLPQANNTHNTPDASLSFGSDGGQPPGSSPSGGSPEAPPVYNLLSNLTNADMSSLFAQINHLRETNKSLESQLGNMSQELVGMRKAGGVPPNTGAPNVIVQPPTPAAPTPAAHDLAISVWQTTRDGRSSLIECNDRFVNLLGYPLDALKSGFSCTRLIPQHIIDADDLFDAASGGQTRISTPQRTQMITAEGLKDVYVIFTPLPILDPNVSPACKYWVIHVNELRR